jgi:hypothetical protein
MTNGAGGGVRRGYAGAKPGDSSMSVSNAFRAPEPPSGGYPVTLAREPGGIAVVRGPRQPRSLAPQVRLWTAAVDASREAGCSGVLIIDAMFGAPELHEVRTLVDDVIVRGWGDAKLAWVLLEPSNEGRAAVAEVWTRLRGIRARAFRSEDVAREWLLET